MTSIARTATAFVVSPAASTLVVVATLSVIGRAVPSPGYTLTVAGLIYGAAIVIGIPAFLLSRGWHLHSVGFYASAALVAATPLLVVAAMLTGGVELPLVAGFGAVTGGLVFHQIMERRPNNPWRER